MNVCIVAFSLDCGCKGRHFSETCKRFLKKNHFFVHFRPETGNSEVMEKHFSDIIPTDTDYFIILG